MFLGIGIGITEQCEQDIAETSGSFQFDDGAAIQFDDGTNVTWR